MNKHFHIQLTDEERGELKRLVESGRKLARKITRARILLLADAGKKTGRSQNHYKSASKRCTRYVSVFAMRNPSTAWRKNHDLESLPSSKA